MVDIEATCDPQGLRAQWEAQREARRARVAAAIASFGTPEMEYHQHIMWCDACAGPYDEMCVEGRRLYDGMMAEERRAGER